MREWFSPILRHPVRWYFIAVTLGNHHTRASCLSRPHCFCRRLPSLQLSGCPDLCPRPLILPLAWQPKLSGPLPKFWPFSHACHPQWIWRSEWGLLLGYQKVVTPVVDTCPRGNHNKHWETLHTWCPGTAFDQGAAATSTTPTEPSQLGWQRAGGWAHPRWQHDPGRKTISRSSLGLTFAASLKPREFLY